MQNRWALPGHASAVQPSSSTSGEALLPPPFPPDPPDPSSPLSPLLCPPIASTPPLTRSELRRSHLFPPLSDTVMTPAQDLSAAGAISEKTTQFGSLAEIESQTTIPATGNPNLFPSFASQNFPDFFPPNQLFNFTSAPPVATNVLAFQPNHNSPLLSNPAPTVGKTSHFVLTPNHNHKSFHPPTQSPSDKPQKPSLKRSRSSPTFSPPAPPKITFQSSNPPQISLFPDIATLKYLENSPFIGPATKNPFSPLL
ncbi:hypothetical protein HID58_002580, partial [Brassica napus]